MNEEKDNGPYKATKMWNEMIQLFQNEIPLKRHRHHMKVYENCFTGSEAINWFHSALQNKLQIKNVITREQTIQLLNKFLKAGVYESVAASNGPVSLKEGELYRLKNSYTGFMVPPDLPATQWSRIPLGFKSNYHENLENVKVTAGLRSKCGCAVMEYESMNRQDYRKGSKDDVKNKQTHHCCEDELSKNCNNVKNAYAAYCRQNLRDAGSSKWVVSSSIRQLQHKEEQTYSKKPFSEHNMVTKKQGLQSTTNKHHIIARNKTEAFNPLLHKEESWKTVVLYRLEMMAPRISDHIKEVPAKWIAANATGSHEANFKLHESLVLGLQYLEQWPQAAPSGTLLSIEEYFKNLTEPLTTFNLHAAMTLVLSDLSMWKIGQFGSSVFDTVLPPNTCFETAFTSDSPITRIVPQSSFDTLHLKWCNRQKRREHIIPEVSETTDKHKHGRLGKIEDFGNKRPFTFLQCSDKNDNQFDFHLLNHIQNSSEGYVNPVMPHYPARMQSLHMDYNQKLATMYKSQTPKVFHMHNDSQSYVSHSIADSSRIRINDQVHHIYESCGSSENISSIAETSLTPHMQLDSSNCQIRMNRAKQDSHIGLLSLDEDVGSSVQEKRLQHLRNKSGGYVNPAMDDMDEVKLDYGAALGYLQLLMRCSLEKPVIEDSGSESSSYYTAVSSSSSSAVSSRCSSHSLGPNDAGDALQHCNEIEEEKLQVVIMQLLLLCIPPYNRFQLRFLLQFIKYWNLDNPDMNVMSVFSSSIVRSHNASAVHVADSSKILKFLLIHQDHVLSIPSYLCAEVQQHAAKLEEVFKKQGPTTFCERVSCGQFEHQRLTSSQQALSELLEQILSDCKMPAKEKRKRLRMFQASYPHIYQRRFPESVQQEKAMKKPSKGILNFGRNLKSLRV